MDVCPTCKGNGWLCEKHPGMHWPHAATRTECSAQGIPCDCPAGAYVLPHRVIWLNRATDRCLRSSDHQGRRAAHSAVRYQLSCLRANSEGVDSPGLIYVDAYRYEGSRTTRCTV